jgi:RHH-type proline utilization regulon transcriptional repressor/proline dehydrogenase/delta 1-pyrroline-5-carboxylate dehydrogenase
VLAQPVQALVEAASTGLEPAELDSLRRAATSAQRAWSGHFAARDVSGLRAEHNVLRYRSTIQPVEVRLAAGGALVDLAKVLVAALTAGTGVVVSAATELPDWLAGALAGQGSPCLVEDEETFTARLAAAPGGRVRLIGAPAADLLDGIGGRPDVSVYANPVT